MLCGTFGLYCWTVLLSLFQLQKECHALPSITNQIIGSIAKTSLCCTWNCLIHDSRDRGAAACHSRGVSQKHTHTHTLPPCVSRQSQNPALNCAPPHLHSKCHRMAKSQLEFAGSVSFDSGEPAIRPCCIGSAFKMLNFCSNATFFRYHLTNCMIIQGGARKYHGSFKTLQ